MRSMTGYARRVETIDGVEISVEVKTLNSKYLSPGFSLPGYMSGCEVRFNEVLGEYIKRGKVTVKVYLRFIEPPRIEVDFASAQAYYDALEELSSRLGIPEPVKIEDILRFKEVLRFELSEEEVEKVCRSVEVVLRKTLEDLVKEKEIEGEKLKKALSDILDGIEEELSSIEKMAGEMIEHYARILRENVEKIIPEGVEIDENVLETEIAVLAERSDIREEIDRLKSHILRSRELLNEEPPVGPNLDFLAQEMLREFNTILSKSRIKEITESALNGKVLVNSFREQVQNVE